jgi:hypothetical protein
MRGQDVLAVVGQSSEWKQVKLPIRHHDQRRFLFDFWNTSQESIEKLLREIQVRLLLHNLRTVLCRRLFQFILRRQRVSVNGVMRQREREGVRIVENIFEQKLRRTEFALELAKINRLRRFFSRS